VSQGTVRADDGSITAATSAGHVPWLEAPADFARLVLEFLGAA
jgi:pimeloyl-ACP methyl ester carboxylesterase